MSSEPNRGALSGVRVVDLSRVLGGPYCTQILGDHGADIVKIEPPQGDETRHWGPPFDDGEAAYYLGVNRNKRSIGLDLTLPEGREVLFRMLDDADVLVENFKPGTLDRWGIGYEAVLRERYPRLIHCALTGFGGDGPLGGFPGYDAIAQAMTGVLSVNGEPESGRSRIGIPLVDLGTGLYAVIAILMALQERHRSGLGQSLDVSLYDCGLALMHPHVPNYLYSGRVPGLTGNAHPNISPYDCYPTASCDIMIGAGNDRAFGRLCSELGSPELADDPRFASNALRIEHRPALTAALVERLAGLDGEALCVRLLEVGLVAGPVYDTEQALAHPHARHRGMLVEQGSYRGTGTPLKMSRSQSSLRHRPPHFGEQGRELLREHGYDEAQIDAMLQAGALVERRR